MTELTPESGAESALTGKDAAETREKAVEARAALTRTRMELERQQAQAKEELERQRQDLEAQHAAKRAELEAQMAPLKEELAKMVEVLWTVDLYLGRDETIELIREGQPASAETPITIRQKVLVMAEESLVLMDRPGSRGMDYRDIEAFVDWLKAAPENLDRLLPEEKGVVVLVPTRVESRSGNVWEDAAKNAANEASYWLLRNGERLYLLTVDEALHIRERVLPRRTEFTEVFDRGLFGYGRRSGEPLKPGSEEWLAIEKIADARRRHYMRVMLVLQGIIDRTPAWHPLPEGGVNLLTVEAQDSGKVVLVQDGDDSIMLTDGRETFLQYQRRLNALLRPGLRVIGDWYSRRELYGWDEGDNHRISPEHATGLDPEVPHLLEDRKDGGFVFRFERTDKVWKREVPVPDKPGYVYRGMHPTTPTRRASYLLYPDDPWVLPYDLVTEAELERLLESREERSKHFLSMVPTIKAALAAKRREAEQEAPFRVLLHGSLVSEGADYQEADAILDDLVHWWKVKNTWSKPLNGEPHHETKALCEITAEFRERQKAAAKPDQAEKMVAAGKKVPGVIAVARNRQDQWFAYAPSTEGEDVFLDITPIRKNGTLGETKAWAKVQQRTASLLHVAWSEERWGEWKFAANPRHYLTGPERDDLVARVRERAEGTVLAVTEFHDSAHPEVRGLATYAWTYETPPEETETVVSSDPLGGGGYGDPSKYVTMRPYRVSKSAQGITLEERNISRSWGEIAFRPYFGGYSGGSRWGETPWWPREARTYADARARLVWADEDALDRVAAYRNRCKEAAAEQRDEKRRREAEAYRYSRPIEAAIYERQVAEVRARFDEDYGTEAADLWPAHLKSLNLTAPIHPRMLWGLVAIALDHGHPVVGQTLDELADVAIEQNNRAPGGVAPRSERVDVKDYGDLIVPEPETEQEGPAS